MRETFSVKSALYLDMNEKLPDVSEYEKKLEKLESDYKKGKISDTTFEPEAAVLQEQINDGHNRQFVGKVGEFCPIKPGCYHGDWWWHPPAVSAVFQMIYGRCPTPTKAGV